jgi:hypothetical protein
VSYLETELRTTEARAVFVVRTDEPALQEALAGLLYAPGEMEFTRSFPPGAPGLADAYRRFERCARELLEQAAHLRVVPWQDALRDAATRLDRASVEWFLCGSAGLAARGIDVEPGDVDLVVSDHARAMSALGDALVEPVGHDAERGWVAAWFGRAFLGARVEWIAGVYPEVSEPNEFGADAMARLETVDWQGRRIRVTPLDLQLAVCERRGLEDRAAKIRSFAGL